MLLDMLRLASKKDWIVSLLDSRGQLRRFFVIHKKSFPAFSQRISCTVIHKYPQTYSEITLANVSASSYHAPQIDREEKLHDSIQSRQQG